MRHQLRGCENKYLIKWAQEPQVENIKDAAAMILTPDPSTFAKRNILQKEQLKMQKSWKKTTTMLKFSLSNLGASRQIWKCVKSCLRRVCCFASCGFCYSPSLFRRPVQLTATVSQWTRETTWCSHNFSSLCWRRTCDRRHRHNDVGSDIHI